MQGLTDHSVSLDGTQIAYSRGGDGPPLLLLHGFPQTREMWAHIAPALARTHEVICPDPTGDKILCEPLTLQPFPSTTVAV